MNKIEVRHFFDAAHQLKDSSELVTKACAQLHGHTYGVIVEVAVDELNRAGMVIDFKAIKQVIDRLDHKYINDVFRGLDIKLEPSAENIAIVIYDWVEQLDPRLRVLAVKVCEGYKGLERASWAIYEPHKR